MMFFSFYSRRAFLAVCVCCGWVSWVRFGVLLSGSSQHNKARRQKQRTLAINNSRALPSQWPTADQPQTQQERTHIHAFAFGLCGIESQKYFPAARTLSPYEEKREVSICALCPNLHSAAFARVHVVCLTRAKQCVHNPCVPCSCVMLRVCIYTGNIPRGVNFPIKILSPAA